MKRKPYDSDLTDAQWSVIEPMLPPPKRRGRPRADMREIINAGCSWRMLPHDLPPWPTVHKYTNGTIPIHQWLVAQHGVIVEGRPGQEDYLGQWG